MNLSRYFSKREIFVISREFSHRSPENFLIILYNVELTLFRSCGNSVGRSSTRIEPRLRARARKGERRERSLPPGSGSSGQVLTAAGRKIRRRLDRVRSTSPSICPLRALEIIIRCAPRANQSCAYKLYKLIYNRLSRTFSSAYVTHVRSSFFSPFAGAKESLRCFFFNLT